MKAEDEVKLEGHRTLDKEELVEILVDRIRSSAPTEMPGESGVEEDDTCSRRHLLETGTMALVGFSQMHAPLI